MAQSRKRDRSSSSPALPTSRYQDREPGSAFDYSLDHSDHISQNGLQTLHYYRDDGRSSRTRYQTSLYMQYWEKPNGAVTEGVLHLAYPPDAEDEAEREIPDIVRAEYERISASIDWAVGERGRSGGALVVYGQPGSGKSRCLRVERGRLFEAGRPCIVTDTRRNTFDLYCDVGPFFNIPLSELAHLRFLVPTIALVDAAEGPNGTVDLQHEFVERLIANVFLVFATSPRLPRWLALSKRIHPTLQWTIQVWPDGELAALETLLKMSSSPSTSWRRSPKVYLQRAKRKEETHLPPALEVVRPPSPSTTLELQRRLPIRPITDQGNCVSPPSAFLPDDAPYYQLPAGLSSSNPAYTLSEAVHLLGRSVRLPLEKIRQVRRKKSRPPECRLEDLHDGLPLFQGLFSSLIHIELISGRADDRGRTAQADDVDYLEQRAKELQIDDKKAFHTIFMEVPTPGVPRPSLQIPKSIIKPASAPLERFVRSNLEDCTLSDLARHARSFTHHPVVYGITHEVYSVRVIELAGAWAVLADKTTFPIPRLSRVSIDLPLLKTAAGVDKDESKTSHTVTNFDYDSLSQQKPAFPVDEGTALPRLVPGLYLPQSGLPTLDGIALYYTEDGQLVVVALKMTVSDRDDVKLGGIHSLYTALGPYAEMANLCFAFVVPDTEKGAALVVPQRTALLSPPTSLSRPRRGTRSAAEHPFTWSRAYIVIDPHKPPGQAQPT